MTHPPRQFCTACGSKAGDRPFCTNCGQAIQPLPPAPVPQLPSQVDPPEYDTVIPSVAARAFSESDTVVPSTTPVDLSKRGTAAATPQAPWQQPTSAHYQPSPRPTGGRGGRWALVLAAVLILALVGGGLSLLLWSSDEPNPTAADPDATAPSVDSGQSTDADAPTADPPPESPVEASSPPAAAPKPKDVTCWNKVQVRHLKNCTRPAGVAGLEWVFPSFDSGSSDCFDAKVGTSIQRPQMWECIGFIDDRRVRLRYSHVGSVATSLSYYTDQYAAGNREAVTSPDGKVERYIWRLPTTNDKGVYKLSALYAKFPYSISVEAGSIADRERALDELMVFRSPKEIPGVQS